MAALIRDWLEDLRVERGPNCVVVRMLDVAAIEDDAEGLAEQLLAIMQQHFTHRLVLECDEITHVTTAVLEQLAKLQQRVAEEAGLLRLCGLRAAALEELIASTAGEGLPVYPDRNEAMLGDRLLRQPR